MTTESVLVFVLLSLTLLLGKRSHDRELDRLSEMVRALRSDNRLLMDRLQTYHRPGSLLEVARAEAEMAPALGLIDDRFVKRARQALGEPLKQAFNG
jgi:hypothetical protein